MSDKEVVLRTSSNAGDYLVKKVSDLEAYSAFREKVDEFINSKLTSGTDYGEPFEGSGKKTLLLPGAQKIARLLALKPIMFADELTHRMMGKPDGVVCFSCYLIPYEQLSDIMALVQDMGKINTETICKILCLSEGRGAGNIADERKNLKENALIKKAQKRAFVDSVIRISDLSDQFHVDIEDMNLDEDDEDPFFLDESDLSDDDLDTKNPLTEESDDKSDL